MIEIQIRMATISLSSLISALLSAACTSVGFVLSVHGYHDGRHVMIPCYFTSASALVLTIAQLLNIPWAYRPMLSATNAIFTLILAGSGLYYISERISQAPSSPKMTAHRNSESAFIVLWLLSSLISTAVTAYAGGEMSVIGSDSEDSESGRGTSSTKGSSTSTKGDGEPVVWQKPQAMNSFIDLGSPLDIPVVSTNMPQLSPQLSPRSSWPSVGPSPRRTSSFTSLQSALDIRNGTTTKTQNNHHESEHISPSKQNSPKKKLSKSLTLSNTFPNNLSSSPKHKDNENHSPKSPKSPLKVNLKSSFSLKRESSRLSRKLNSVSPQVASPHAASSSGLFPPIPGSSNGHGSHSHGLHGSGTVQSMDGFPHPVGLMGIDQDIPKSFMIIPNDSSGESRSVSGSSQVTGHIFPASEYNRKINAAGFQKDEPRPIILETSRETFSQYDLERAIKSRNHGSKS